MTFTRTDILKITEFRRAKHAIEHVVSQCQSYADISYWVGRNIAVELLGPGQNYFDQPTQNARDRVVKQVLAKWKWNRCEVLARDAVTLAFSEFTKNATQSGIDSSDAHLFLSRHIRPNRLDS